MFGQFRYSLTYYGLRPEQNGGKQSELKKINHVFLPAKSIFAYLFAFFASKVFETKKMDDEAFQQLLFSFKCFLCFKCFDIL